MVKLGNYLIIKTGKYDVHLPYRCRSLQRGRHLLQPQRQLRSHPRIHGLGWSEQSQSLTHDPRPLEPPPLLFFSCRCIVFSTVVMATACTAIKQPTDCVWYPPFFRYQWKTIIKLHLNPLYSCTGGFALYIKYTFSWSLLHGIRFVNLIASDWLLNGTLNGFKSTTLSILTMKNNMHINLHDFISTAFTRLKCLQSKSKKIRNELTEFSLLL